jgi:hypothetical protein
MPVRHIAIDECSDNMAEDEGISLEFDFEFFLNEGQLEGVFYDNFAQGDACFNSVLKCIADLYGEQCAAIARSRLVLAVTGRLEEAGGWLRSLRIII